MACVCGRYNARSDCLIVEHQSPVVPTGRLRACKDKARSHVVNNLLTSNVPSWRENLKPRPCHIDLAIAQSIWQLTSRCEIHSYNNVNLDLWVVSSSDQMTHQTELFVIFCIMINIFPYSLEISRRASSKKGCIFDRCWWNIWQASWKRRSVPCLWMNICNGSRGTLILSGWTLDRIEIITFAVSFHFAIPTMFYLSSSRFNVA